MRTREKKGYLITFEKTVEGIGGTTQAKQLVDNLQKLGYDAIYTREPGGTSLGVKLRELMLREKTALDAEPELSHATELFLMMADRAQHYKEVLKPAMLSGRVVVCDRYVDSTLVYQGNGRGWSRGFLLQLHQKATGALMPDLTFVMDGKPHRKKPNVDRFEGLGTSFFDKVKAGMLTLAQTDGRFVMVDANRPLDVVAAGIQQVAVNRIPSRLRK